jgi:hypothetical protein
VPHSLFGFGIGHWHWYWHWRDLFSKARWGDKDGLNGKPMPNHKKQGPGDPIAEFDSIPGFL